MAEIRFLASDQSLLFGQSWEMTDRRKEGIILILHGMGEHALRYQNFAQRMNEAGYVVYAYDQRGHGKTGKASNVHGYLGPDGFHALIADARSVLEQVRSLHPDVPVVVLGHSMGSIVAQSLMTWHGNELDACVLCGTLGPQGFLLVPGMYIAKSFARKHGPHVESTLLTRMTFGAYNRQFRPNETPYDWITSDRDSLQVFLADEMCGFPLSAASMHDMFECLSQIHREESWQRIPRELPILMISGQEDPVGGKGKTVRRLYRIYQRHQLENVFLQLYPGARHELFHETIREIVFQDVLAWLNSNLHARAVKR